MIEEPGVTRCVDVWTVLDANPSGNYQGIFHRLRSCPDLLPQGPLGYSRGEAPCGYCGTLGATGEGLDSCEDSGSSCAEGPRKRSGRHGAALSYHLEFVPHLEYVQHAWRSVAN